MWCVARHRGFESLSLRHFYFNSLILSKMKIFAPRLFHVWDTRCNTQDKKLEVSVRNLVKRGETLYRQKIQYPTTFFRRFNQLNPPPSNHISSLREPNAVFRRFIPRIKAVFSQGDFACGGRLYSAGIRDRQSMPQAQRNTIRIDHCRTVELDFNSFHFSMFYALEGIQITEDPCNTAATGQLRPVVKKLLLTASNASSIRESSTPCSTRFLS